MIIELGKKTISTDSPCFVIAEIGHNHQGSMETAKKMVDEAARNGADCIKLQKRYNKGLYTTEMYNKPYENPNSFGKTYGEHREALEFGESEYRELKRYTEGKGLVFLSTAFDFESVDFLEGIGVPAYKVASGDLTNDPLLDYIASKKKPVFMSTGAAEMAEVEKGYRIVKKHIDEICVMQCTATYPAAPEDIHLNVIRTYREAFPDAIIGYSGHDSGIMFPIVAYVLGARVVEKHFTLNRAMKGTDHKFSHEPLGLSKMVRDLSRIRVGLGSYEKHCLEVELPAREKMGKSIVVMPALEKGTVLKREHIAFKSPGNGIPPSRLAEVVEKTLARNLTEETLLSFNDVE